MQLMKTNKTKGMYVRIFLKIKIIIIIKRSYLHLFVYLFV